MQEQALFKILNPKNKDFYFTDDHDKIYDFCSAIGYDIVDFYDRDLFDCQCFRDNSEHCHLLLLFQNIASITEFDPDLSLLVFPNFIYRKTNLRPYLNHIVSEIDLPLILIRNLILRNIRSANTHRSFAEINEHGKYYFYYV